MKFGRKFSYRCVPSLTYVTWQFTENEGGVRDYYWGHYHTDREWAERDFSRRIDDYQLIVAAIVPVIALKVFNKGSIVEKLRVAE